MPIPTAAAYFDQMRTQEHHLRHTLPPLTGADVNRLPNGAQFLAKQIGLPATLALVNSLGGITLRIPHGTTPAGKKILEMLAKHVGQEAAQKLAAEYGASQLYIPTCKNLLQKARDAALMQDRARLAAEGLSERDIAAILALRYGMSDRNIWKIFKKPLQEEVRHEVRQASMI